MTDYKRTTPGGSLITITRHGSIHCQTEDDNTRYRLGAIVHDEGDEGLLLLLDTGGYAMAPAFMVYLAAIIKNYEDEMPAEHRLPQAEEEQQNPPYKITGYAEEDHGSTGPHLSFKVGPDFSLPTAHTGHGINRAMFPGVEGLMPLAKGYDDNGNTIRATYKDAARHQYYGHLGHYIQRVQGFYAPKSADKDTTTE